MSLDAFCTSVVKDDRSFKAEYLHLALRKLKMKKRFENIEKLEEFIKILPNYTEQ